MKKLPLKVLAFLIFLIAGYVYSETRQKILIFSGFVPSWAKSNVKTIIGGATITIGSNTTGNIALSSTVFNSAIQGLSEDQFLPVVLNSAGVINAVHLTEIGSEGDNNISCRSVNSAMTPDITIISSTGRTGLKRNIILNAAGNFYVGSQRITNPVSCTSSLLMIDSYGSVSTSNIENLIILGSDNSFKKQKNYLTVDNSSNQNGITLDTSYVTASSNNIKLNAGLNSINLLFSSSNASLQSLLGVDTNGNLKKVKSVDSVVLGSLVGATNKNQAVNFGVQITGNTFSLSDTTNTIITTIPAYSIVLNAGNHITLASSDIRAPSTKLLSVLLGLNYANSFLTTNTLGTYLLGDNSSNQNNYIVVDNSPANSMGLILNGALKMTGLPDVASLAAGEEATLTIDSTGKIGIIVSDTNRKDNITALKVGDDFYSLNPVSYTVKGKENSRKKFGFLAQALCGSSFEEAIIWGADGEPVSIDYKSILVATIYKFFETRKELLKRVQELEAKMQQREEVLSQLRKEIMELRAIQYH